MRLLKLFRNDLKTSLNTILVFVLTVQISLSPLVVYSQGNNHPNSENPKLDSDDPPIDRESVNPLGRELAQKLSQALSSPEDQRHLNSFYETADALEKGTLVIDPSQHNSFKLQGQRVELFRNGQLLRAIDLSNVNEILPELPITADSLRVVTNHQTNELIFEYVLGMKADRTGGEIVARHVIPDLNIAAYAIDPVTKNFYIVEKTGQIHGIHGGFQLSNLFQSHIPVVKLYQTPNTDHPFLRAQGVRGYIVNSGIKPFTEDMRDESTVIRRSAEGQELYSDRDLYIEYVDEAGKKRAFGVFSHKLSEAILNDAGKFIFRMLAEYNPSIASIEAHEELRQLEALEEKVASTPIDSKNPFVDDFLRTFSPEQVTKMFQNYKKTAEAGAENLGMDLPIRNWTEYYNHVYSNFTRSKGIEPGQDLTGILEAELARTWPEHVAPVSRTNPVGEDFFEKLSRQAYGKTNLRKVFTVAVGVGSMYFSFPHIFENSPEHKITMMNWIYQNVYSHTPAMLDAIYRSDLLASMSYLLFIWPLMVGASWGAEKLIKLGYSKYKDSDTRLGRYFRELHQNWANLGTWQRMITFGMRLYAKIVYPYVRFVVESALRQKDFTSAVDARVNPFQKVKKESELGRRLGLERDYRVGINKIFGAKPSEHEVRQKIQAEIRYQKNQATALAWVIATIVVGQDLEIDPATLKMVMENRVNLDELDKILKDPRLRKEWELVSEKAFLDIKLHTQNFNKDIGILSESEISKFYSYAYEVGQELRAKRGLELTLKKLRSRSNEVATDLSIFLLTTGYKESQFYARKGNVVGEHATSLAFKEATVDIPLTILTMGLTGERADLTRASDLSAQQGEFLRTHPQHQYEIFYNYQGHMVSNGAKLSIVWQALDSQTRYPEFESFDKFQYRPNDRHQGVFNAAGSWLRGFSPINGLTEGTKHLPHPQLFETSWAGFKNNFATIQAKSTLSILGRLAVIPAMTLGSAFSSFAYSFFATQAAYTIFMDVLYAGNSAEETRIRTMNKSFDATVIKIREASRELDAERSAQMYLEGYSEMMELYKQSNRSALKRLEGLLQKEMPNSDIASALKNTYALDKYYGLLAELAIAMKQGDQVKANQYRTILEDILNENLNVSKTDLAKLNAQGILNFAMSNSPIYFMKSYHTARHNFESTIPSLTWTTTAAMVVFAAWFYSGTAVNMFDPSKITTENIFFVWLPSIFLGYGVLKLIYSQAAWEFYLSPTKTFKEWSEKTKAFWVKRSTVEDKEMRLQESRNRFLKNGCQMLFMN